MHTSPYRLRYVFSHSDLRPFLLYTALIALSARPAFADGAIGPRPYRRPSELTQTIQHTAQSHLEAAQRALQLASTLLSRLENGNSAPYSLSGHDNLVIWYGGHFQRALADLSPALDAVKQALVHVREHPESNVLANGPVPTNEPAAPAHPKIRTSPTINNASIVEQAVDAVDAALQALTNDPSPEYRGPIIGDLGGHRAKVIAAMVRVGGDLGQANAYLNYVRGGESGIIIATAPTDIRPDPEFGPTAKSYLKQAEMLLTAAARAMTNPPLVNQRGQSPADPTQGGYVPKLTADLQRVYDSIARALTYLRDHPEADTLGTGQATPEPSAVRRLKAPASATALPVRKQGNAPRINADTLSYLNSALESLMNNPAPDYRGPVLGDLGGHRGKIMDGIGVALNDALAAIDLAYSTSPAPTAPAQKSPVP